MTLSLDFRAAWTDYEAANKRAHLEYLRRPSAKPKDPECSTCLCCAVLTAQFGVCLSCQSRLPEWAELDRDALIEIRRADMFPLARAG